MLTSLLEVQLQQSGTDAVGMVAAADARLIELLKVSQPEAGLQLALVEGVTALEFDGARLTRIVVDAYSAFMAAGPELVLRDGIFGNWCHFRELLEAWAAHALQLVVGIRVRGHNYDVVQHSAEALPRLASCARSLLSGADAVPCPAATVGLPAAHAPACGGQRVRW